MTVYGGFSKGLMKAVARGAGFHEGFHEELYTLYRQVCF